jgi:hypothetical protein
LAKFPVRDVNSLEQQFLRHPALNYETFTLNHDPVDITDKLAGIQPDVVRNKYDGDARDEDWNRKMLPVSSCMSTSVNIQSVQ